jgi:branched-chain amino acid transport system permease protein
LKRRKERVDRGIKVRSSDIFALCSWREMLYLAVPRLLPVVVCLLLPVALSVYWQKVLLSVAVFALLAMSWDILAQAGMISLGQALFFGVGAYCAGLMNHYWHLPPWITLPAAALAGGVICTLVLLPVLRLRGIYFSMVTLIIPLMMVRIIEATKILGGTAGLSALTPLPGMFFSSALSMTAMWVVVFSLRRMITTDYGIIFIALNDNDRKRAKQIARYPWFEKKRPWQAEIQRMLKNDFKLEVESLISKDISYVTEVYVPERLEAKDWLD